MRLAAHGIGVELPDGWEGEVYRRGDDSFRLLAAGETSRSVTHVANFPLPPRRGDYGSGAVEVMTPGDMLLILFEFEPEAASSALFSHHGKPEVRAEDFAPNRLQRTLAGQAGVQYFFQEAGRTFCLYIVLGGANTAPDAAAQANALLAQIEIAGPA